ncbi:hypothetical protein G6M50_30175 [Agrobacterium rhizogenes]|nr:hypothetical protein [Rhizobium rhizogenes]NTJ82059.1 hypothetical protein [Rhizobium rhizogenes]
MSFLGFGRKMLGLGVFGRKGLNDQQTSERGFGERPSVGDNSPFQRFFEQLERERDLTKVASHQHYATSKAMEFLSPEERGELLADLADRQGIHDGNRDDKSPREKAAYNAAWNIWRHDIEVRKEHLGALLTYLLGNPNFRDKGYYEVQFGKLMQLIDRAIKQGAYLSGGDCEALAQMATAVRNGHKAYSKADTKKMITRAAKLEKLAGVKVSATEFLMQRCEGAENPWAIADRERPNAKFWADLLAEITIALEEIRAATKGNKPRWLRDITAFATAWPTVGEVAPRFKAWDEGGKPFASLSQHNGKRTGFTDPDAYRDLPRTIVLAQAHSRYNWKSDQIPGLDVLADLENPQWTALVEQLITQRRATQATKAWEKDILALCQTLGIETVETKLHDWLALFHTPALDMAVYTDVCNGERFAATIDRLDEAHPGWPAHYAEESAALGRAVAMKIASDDGKDICGALQSQLIRRDDHVYKNTRVTDGILGLAKPSYKHSDGRSTYESLATWMRLSVENEEFLRGAVWLVALMPNRARAIDALEKIAKTAATYVWTGEDGMRSKIVANAAVATLISMGGSDIGPAVLRLSKTIDNRTINPPLFKYLNGDH